MNEFKLNIRSRLPELRNRNYLPYVDVVNILKLLYKIIIYEIRNFLKRILNNKQRIIVYIKASLSISYVNEL